MPRLDLLQAEGDPAAYRAGFWGFARIGPRPAGATIVLGPPRNGGVDAELARIAVAEPLEPLPGAPQIAICMAAFEPPLELFRAPGRVDPRADPDRLDLRRQRRLLGPAAVRGNATRCSPATRGSCCRARSGGAASTTTSSARWRWRPRDARYVALADQDDAWDPDKLETLVRELGDAQLVYSDQRIVSPDG